MKDLHEFAAEMEADGQKLVEAQLRLDRQREACAIIMAAVAELGRIGFAARATHNALGQTFVLICGLTPSTTQGAEMVQPIEVIAAEETPTGLLPAAGDETIAPDAKAPIPPDVDTPAVVAGAVESPQPAAVANPYGVPWSTVEDASAVEIYAKARSEGIARIAAIQVVADVLARPFSGIESRLKNKLALAVTQAMHDLARIKPELPAEPAAQSVVDQVVVPAATARQTLAVIAVDPLRHHLLGLRRLGKHKIDDDLEMMESICDGFEATVVADQIGIDVAEVKRRFDALTGFYRDDDSKPRRKWSREQVLMTLRALLQVTGRGAATAAK